MFCKNCGNELPVDARFCPKCGTVVAGENPIFEQNKDVEDTRKSKLAAGLFGIFLGGFGVHNFYLGFNGRGVAQIILSVCGCGIGGIWGLIEGIMILAGSINRDADGNSLKQDC